MSSFFAPKFIPVNFFIISDHQNRRRTYLSLTLQSLGQQVLENPLWLMFSSEKAPSAPTAHFLFALREVHAPRKQPMQSDPGLALDLYSLWLILQVANSVWQTIRKG